jgi:hypothetical protein
MKKLYKNNQAFFCFSPPVMIATFAIEIGLLLYTIIRYRMSPLTRLVAVTLACLALFQLAEFNVCEGPEGIHEVYSRIGFMAITLLPPLGIHMVQTIAGRGPKWLLWVAYATGLAYIVTFGFHAEAFQSNVCAGNYAVFQLMNNLGGLFFAYYYFWLFVAIVLCLYYGISGTKKIREALALQAFGLLSFVLPTGVVNALHPETIHAIPSVMCGFAVAYALILTFAITPRILQKK